MSRGEELLPAWATQYYVGGRLAARAGHVPVYGNLLHHAVELYLKSALIGVISPAQMRSMEFGHNLERLWRRYKAHVTDSALDRFDATLQA